MISISTERSDSSKPGCFGAAFGALFCLMFGIIGSIFAYFLVADLVYTAGTYTWKEQRCEVVESRVDEDAKKRDFTPVVRYQLRSGEKLINSDQIQKRPWRTSDVGEANRFVLKFPKGAKVSCYQNPSRPEDLILQRHSFFQGLFLIIPLVFMAVGFGGLWVIFLSRKTERGKKVPLSVSISKQASSGKGAGIFLILFFSIFLLAGLGITATMIPDMKRALESSSWQKAPAKVISSELRRDDSGDDGPTYSIDILYEYTVQGRTLRSNTYQAFNASSSGRAEKQAIVDAHKPGETVQCYINPEDPTYAVLVTGLGWHGLFILFPLIFVGVGLGGVYWGIRSLSKKPDTTGAYRFHSSVGERNRTRTGVPEPRPASGAIELQPSSTPVGRFVGMLFVALFWNGIVSIFAYNAVMSVIRGRPEYILCLFITPFVLIGLFLIWGAVHSFLAIFLPRPKLTISRLPIPLGQTAEIRWQIPSGNNRIKALQVSLIGTEKATYTRGTDRTTAEENFFREDYPLQNAHTQRAEGSVTIKVPAKTMHSFSSDNNKIVWKLHLEGEVARFPNIKEEYEIQVIPGAPVTLRSSAGLGGEAVAPDALKTTETPEKGGK